MLYRQEPWTSYQFRWTQLFHQWILGDREVVQVAEMLQAVVDRVADQVNTGPHDKGDDRQVSHRARQVSLASLL